MSGMAGDTAVVVTGTADDQGNLRWGESGDSLIYTSSGRIVD